MAFAFAQECAGNIPQLAACRHAEVAATLRVFMSIENLSVPSTTQAKLGGFWALIATQFQGAFSDNTLKWLVSFLVIDAGMSQERRDLYFILVVPLLFAIPFLLFSIPGGYLADRYSKRSVTIRTKWFEVLVMLMATAAFALHRLDLAGIALFLACTQGALFGPTKYGLLPELLPLTKLSWGNGIIELTTLLAAIFGALAGGFLANLFRGQQWRSGVFFLLLSVIGLLTSHRITRLPAADPQLRFNWNWVAQFFREIGRIRRDAPLKMAVVANTFFWFLGSLLLLNIVLYATDVLRVDETHSSYLLAALSMGIGVGSFLAGIFSRGKIELGMILPGTLGLVVCCALLSRPGLSFRSALVHLALLGVFGGFFVVPVNALIQQRPKPEEKGRTIAAVNLLSFLGVALQPLAQYTMLRLGHPDPTHVFLIAAAGTLLMGAALVAQSPSLWSDALLWTRLRHSDTL